MEIIKVYLYTTIELQWRFGWTWVNFLNSLMSSDAYMRQYTIPILLQIMACRLFGAWPLSEPMLPTVVNWAIRKFYIKFKRFHGSKCVWKCHLLISRPFCLVLNWPGLSVTDPDRVPNCQGIWSTDRHCSKWSILSIWSIASPTESQGPLLEPEIHLFNYTVPGWENYSGLKNENESLLVMQTWGWYTI